MKLPYRTNAYISRTKLTGYLLSEVHTVGKFKAKFFRRLGLNESNVTVFAKGLKNIARSQPVLESVSSQYGVKYIIDGQLSTPSGRAIKIRTIWIIPKEVGRSLEPDQKRPYFVTAYPV